MQSEKEKILAFATTWMDFETARERLILYDLIYES